MVRVGNFLRLLSATSTEDPWIIVVYRNIQLPTSTSQPSMRLPPLATLTTWPSTLTLGGSGQIGAVTDRETYRSLSG